MICCRLIFDEQDNPNRPIGKQCKLLSISRSSFYYQPKGATVLNLMRFIGLMPI